MNKYPYQGVFVKCGNLRVTGGIWWPYGAECWVDRDITGRDLDDMLGYEAGEIDQDMAEQFAMTHCGDFSSVDSWELYFNTGDGRTLEFSATY